MDPEKRSAIASKGGRAAHACGTAHKWDSEEAKLAGAKGGRAVALKRREAAVALEQGQLTQAGIEAKVEYDGETDEYYDKETV
jgi:hypothetical protein